MSPQLMIYYDYNFISSEFDVIVDSSRAPTHLLVTRVRACHETQKYVVKVSEFTVTTQTYDSKLSGVINVSENITGGWKVKATMQKCGDIRNLNSCDFFKSFFVVHNGCGEDEKEDLYNTLFDFTTPKMKCPIQAGRYELNNYPFSSEENYVTVFESKISTSVFGFTCRLDGYAKNGKKIFCVETYLQLLYKRKHDWVEINDDRPTTTPQTTPQTTSEDEDY